jgi:hypothetical protein
VSIALAPGKPFLKILCKDRNYSSTDILVGPVLECTVRIFSAVRTNVLFMLNQDPAKTFILSDPDSEYRA